MILITMTMSKKLTIPNTCLRWARIYSCWIYKNRNSCTRI